MRVVEGLVHIHEDVGMVHRDLKPSNILLTNENIVKLCDFGISTSGSSNGDDDEDAEIFAAGTPAYMAPECFGREFRGNSALNTCRSFIVDVTRSRTQTPNQLRPGTRDLLATLR